MRSRLCSKVQLKYWFHGKKFPLGHQRSFYEELLINAHKGAGAEKAGKEGVYSFYFTPTLFTIYEKSTFHRSLRGG